MATRTQAEQITWLAALSYGDGFSTVQISRPTLLSLTAIPPYLRQTIFSYYGIYHEQPRFL